MYIRMRMRVIRIEVFFLNLLGEGCLKGTKLEALIMVFNTPTEFEALNTR